MNHKLKLLGILVALSGIFIVLYYPVISRACVGCVTSNAGCQNSGRCDPNDPNSVITVGSGNSSVVCGKGANDWCIDGIKFDGAAWCTATYLCSTGALIGASRVTACCSGYNR